MAARIRQDMKELKALDTEIKRINFQVRKLREKKKILEDNIKGYMLKNNIPQLQYENYIVSQQDSVSHVRKGKIQKSEDIERVLSNMGILDTKRAAEEVLKATQGDEKTQTKIKIKSTQK